MEKTESQREFLPVNQIEWLGNYIDKKRKAWAVGVIQTLTSISNKHKLPMSQVKSTSSSSKLSPAFSLEAINLFKEQLESHPENFNNGRIKLYR